MLGLAEFCFGALSRDAGAEWGRESLAPPSFVRLSFARFSFERFESSRELPAADPPFFAGGVNGRNPSFDLVLFPAAEFTRASFGDMAGA